MVLWSALSPYSKVSGVNPSSEWVWQAHPRSKNMQIEVRLMGDSRSANMRENCHLFYYVDPTMCWRPVHSVPCLYPNVCWDWLQPQDIHYSG